MACFADINVSRGCVATQARCGGIFSMHLSANLPRNLPLTKFCCKSVKIWQNYGHESMAPLFGSSCICGRGSVLLWRCCDTLCTYFRFCGSVSAIRHLGFLKWTFFTGSALETSSTSSYQMLWRWVVIPLQKYRDFKAKCKNSLHNPT